MKCTAIIPAGGKGTRSGFDVPKQYLKIAGREMIVYTLLTFQQNKLVDEIIVSVDKKYFDLLYHLKEKYSVSKLSKIVEGGKERQHSVYNALLKSDADDKDLIAVHDAARPLLSQKILNNAIKTAKGKGNAVVSIKAKDTLIKLSKGKFSYPDRSETFYVQTPQIFSFKILIETLEAANRKDIIGTDESMIISKKGIKINLVEGSPLNFKVTSKEDLEMLKRLLR